MKDREEFIERRKHNRFRVKSGAFVELQRSGFFKIYKTHDIKSGQIIDISSGGLAFQYSDGKIRSPKINKLSIFMLDNDGSQIDDIPCRVVSDQPISEHPDYASLRRCSIEFRKLRHNQKFKLGQFIFSHTIDDGIIGEQSEKENRQPSAVRLMSAEV